MINSLSWHEEINGSSFQTLGLFRVFMNLIPFLTFLLILKLVNSKILDSHAQEFDKIRFEKEKQLFNVFSANWSTYSQATMMSSRDKMNNIFRRAFAQKASFPKLTAADFQRNIAISEATEPDTLVHTFTLQNDHSLITLRSIKLVGAKNSPFEIDSKSRTMKLKPNKNLDREKKDAYTPRVEVNYKSKTRARNKIGKEKKFSLEFSLDIQVTDVNDNPPVFSSRKYRTRVFENIEIGEEVFRFRTTDRDVGRNRRTKYALKKGNHSKYFSITTDSHNRGLLHVKSSLTYDITPEHKYQVQVTATNVVDYHPSYKGSKTSTTTLTINIKREGGLAYFVNHTYTFYVNENVPLNFVVGRVKAGDRYSGKFSYWFLDKTKFFSIQKDTGAITTLQFLDYESGIRKHTLRAAAGKEKYDTAEITILVNDLNDNPPKPSVVGEYQIIACEDSKENQELKPRIVVTDSDEKYGAPFHFKEVKDDNYDKHFKLRVNKDNTASLITKHSNFKSKRGETYIVPYEVSDRRNKSAQYSVTVLVCSCNEKRERLLCSTSQSAISLVVSSLVFLSICCCGGCVWKLQQISTILKDRDSQESKDLPRNSYTVLYYDESDNEVSRYSTKKSRNSRL